MLQVKDYISYKWYISYRYEVSVYVW